MIKINSYSPAFKKDYIAELYKYLYSRLDNACNDKKYKVESAKTLHFKTENKIVDVLVYIRDNLENILKSDISSLRKFQKIIKLKQGKTYRKTKKTEQHKLYAIVYKIFVLEGYERKICDHKDKKIAYGIVKDLGINTCPYCNRNFITSIKRDENKYNKITRPQLDHFISKSEFPFFACSLYNLVPSCSTCNLLKSDDRNDDLISPYELDSSEFQFKYELTKDFQFGKDNSSGIELEITGNFDANKETFLLEELYNSHKYIISDILNKAHEHPKEYTKDLLTFKTANGEQLISLNDVVKSLYSEHLSENEIHNILYGTELSKDEFFKRPLSKLTYDVLSQEGLIDNLNKDKIS